MATPKQSNCSRANGEKSHGPVTPQGKSRSSRNSLKHGLTAKDVVVPPEHQEEFDDIAQGLKADLSPVGAHETLLFHQILSAVWRLLRCDRVEAELAARTTEPDPLLDMALQPVLRTIAAVRAQARKQQKEATAELRNVQTERQYRASVVPELKEDDDNREYGIANLRSIVPSIRKQNDLAELAVINAPMPHYTDEELERKAEELFRRQGIGHLFPKTNPGLDNAA